MRNGLYKLFESSKFRSPCQFLYPAEWSAKEVVTGDSCDIWLNGPLNKAGTYIVSLAVGESVATGQTPTEALLSFLERYHTATDYQELGQATGEIMSNPASEVEIRYAMLLPLEDVTKHIAPLRRRCIFFKYDAYLYDIVYSASEEDYEPWLHAFRILVSSLAFKNEISDSSFNPLIR